MGYYLRDGIHWCDCEGRAVFLDVIADRYFCLPSATNDAFMRLAKDQPRPDDSARLEPLWQRGILGKMDGPSELQSPARVDPPTHDLVLESSCRVSLVLLVRALVAEALSSHKLRTRPFADIIAKAQEISERSRLDADKQHEAATSIAQAEAAITLLRTLRDRCLVRALSVHSLCTKRGVSSKLVFGVIAQPFSAHCWVQCGGAVLVGDYEQARLYTPILVLE